MVAMTASAAPAWGAPLSTKLGSSNWAEDVEEEEEEHGELEAPQASIPEQAAVDDDAFPALGAAPRPKDKKKKGKGVKMSLSDFASSGGYGHGRSRGATPLVRNELTDIRAQLPTHARGADAPRDDFHGDRMTRRDMEFMPSKADDSSSWGADRVAQPAARGGFGGAGGGDRGNFGGFSRADEEDQWGRGTASQPPARGGGMGMGGGFGASRADEGGQWARGSQFTQGPARGEERGNFGGFSRADEEGQWGRGTAAQPPARGGFGASRADEEGQWGRKPAAAALERPVAGGFGGPTSADTSDNWGRAKPERAPAPAAGAPDGPSEADEAPRWGHKAASATRSDRSNTSAERAPAVSEADTVDKWARKSKPAPSSDDPAPKDKGPDGEGKWAGKKESDGDSKWAGKKESDGDSKWAGKKESEGEGKWAGKKESAGAPAQPKRAPKEATVEVEETDEMKEISTKMEELKVRVEMGDGDADATEGDVDESLTVQQLLDRLSEQYDSLHAEALEKAKQASKSAADTESRWSRKSQAPSAPAADAAASEGSAPARSTTPPTDGVAVSADGDDVAAEDEGGFETVVSRSSAKKEKKTAEREKGSGSFSDKPSPKGGRGGRPPARDGARW